VINTKEQRAKTKDKRAKTKEQRQKSKDKRAKTKEQRQRTKNEEHLATGQYPVSTPKTTIIFVLCLFGENY